MKFNRISTAKIQESVDIERLIASQYPDNYLGMQQIQIPQDGGQSIEILAGNPENFVLDRSSQS